MRRREPDLLVGQGARISTLVLAGLGVVLAPVALAVADPELRVTGALAGVLVAAVAAGGDLLVRWVAERRPDRALSAGEGEADLAVRVAAAHTILIDTTRAAVSGLALFGACTGLHQGAVYVLLLAVLATRDDALGLGTARLESRFTRRRLRSLREVGEQAP